MMEKSVEDVSNENCAQKVFPVFYTTKVEVDNKYGPSGLFFSYVLNVIMHHKKLHFTRTLLPFQVKPSCGELGEQQALQVDKVPLNAINFSISKATCGES